MSDSLRVAWLVLAMVPILALRSYTASPRPARGVPALATSPCGRGDSSPREAVGASVTDGMALSQEAAPVWSVFLDSRIFPGTPAPMPAESSLPSVALPLGAIASLRPVGAPRYLPGDFSGASSLTGGVGFAIDPNSRWRFGLDFVLRTDSWDERYRPEAVSTFMVPGMEYMINPQASAPMSLGVITPMSLGDSQAGRGVYFFIRWDEIFGKPSRRR